jgi:hypothetical protein
MIGSDTAEVLGGAPTELFFNAMGVKGNILKQLLRKSGEKSKEQFNKLIVEMVLDPKAAYDLINSARLARATPVVSSGIIPGTWAGPLGAATGAAIDDAYTGP